MKLNRRAARLFGIYFLIFFLGLEIALRITGDMKVYSEQVGFWYQSYWNKKTDSWLHTWKPNRSFELDQKEFSIHYEINSLGLREREFPDKKNSKVTRIICVGDSYTEGDGAEYHETYPRHLENILNEKCIERKFEVFNAGVSGSDILFAHKLIESMLLKYEPDYIIVNINNSEYSDVVQRGGYERFRSNGTTKFKRGPWFHIFYKMSHVVRVLVREVFKMDRMFVSKRKMPTVQKEVCEIVNSSIEKIKTLCLTNDIEPVFFFSLDPWTTEPKNLIDYDFDKSDFNQHFTMFNKLPYLQAFNDEHFYNIWLKMAEKMMPLDYKTYAWPLNGHFNGYGYSLMTEILVDAIQERDPSFFCKTQLKTNE